MMTAPCKDCADRYVGCHGSCPRYAEYAAERQGVYQERIRQAAALEAAVVRGDKMRLDANRRAVRRRMQ